MAAIPPGEEGTPSAGSRQMVQKDRWDKAEVWVPPLASFLQAVVLALLAFGLTGQVTAALEQRKLDLANVSEMRQLHLDLQTASTAIDANASAAALGSFGHYAVVPLVMVIEQGEPTRSAAAEDGLRSAALVDSVAVSRHMIRVLSNRTGLYSWHSHQFAIRLLGELGCRAAVPALEAYRATLSQPDGLEQLRRITSQIRPVTVEQLKYLRTDLEVALNAIRGRTAAGG